MKKFLLETAKIVGAATEKSWSQVHSFSPTEKEKLVKRGQFLAVISLSELAEEIEVVAAGKEMISRLHEEYYGHLEEKAVDQLKKALEQVLEEAKEEAKVEIEAAVLVGDVIYFAIAGRGKILVQRAGKIATILVGEEGVEVASGQVNDNDVFLLGSQKFFSLLAEGAIKAALLADSVNEVAEALMPMIHGQEEDGIAAAAVLKLKSQFEDKPEEVVTPKSELEKEAAVRPIFGSQIFKSGIKRRLIQGLKQVIKLGQLVLFKIEKKLKRRAIYLDKEDKEKQKPQKTLITVAVILLVLLAVSIILGARQRGLYRENGDQTAILSQAQTKKEEGEALIDLNPIRARQLLLEARELVSEISPEEASQEVLNFQNELEESLSLVMREHEVEPSVLFDLVIIKDGARGDDLAISGGELIIFDKEQQTIYSLEGKKSAILAGGEDLAGGQQVAAFLPKIYLLTTRGILEFDKETNRKNLVVEADSEWGEIVDFRAFGGNLYLLDKSGEIWKYPGIEGGFGAYRRWLAGEKPDFSDAVGMTVDGSIWVLKSSGLVLKYTQGLRDAFTISGLDKSLNNPGAIFTDDDQENLYVLDKGNSRIVVINKSGEYYSQYLWEGVREVTGIIASEEEKMILLLAGNKIYKIEIK